MGNAAEEIDQDKGYHELLDVTGLSCPLPVLKSKAQLARMERGQVLKVMATHPDSQKEFPSLCRLPGLDLVATSVDDGVYTFWVQKTL
ncbi:MAG: sulfurtransferase TusA family protein [Candidatus Sedimenticola sp. 20ELBAFRAG]